jgi:hypothetical protein
MWKIGTDKWDEISQSTNHTSQNEKASYFCFENSDCSDDFRLDWLGTSKVVEQD